MRSIIMLIVFVFTCWCEFRMHLVTRTALHIERESSSGSKATNKFNMVDLAGMESAKSNGEANTGHQARKAEERFALSHLH